MNPLRINAPGGVGKTNSKAGVNPLIRLQTRMRADAGQATAEYALVMLAAASLAGLLLAWATSTDAVGRLMNAVIDALLADI